ncbi:sensory rhodopsin transducer [Stenotrophomonas sp.]|uniref:sensory rhodopsin transducer n=1 Tax=Stenotrophomonas sp. TaxID=69392 RepID=UPI0028ADBEE9|nr:sensory rhodopsin transducer [Stenotrophomonas sp.]
MSDANNAALGRTRWAIAEGYIPGWSNGPEPELQSHETCCILNTSSTDAQISLMLYFEDREPQGPYLFTVPAQRTCHKRFNDLQDPAPVPRGVGFSCVIDSDVPVVVQHTRLDSRQAENTIMTTIAYPL